MKFSIKDFLAKCELYCELYYTVNYKHISCLALLFLLLTLNKYLPVGLSAFILKQLSRNQSNSLRTFDETYIFHYLVLENTTG